MFRAIVLNLVCEWIKQLNSLPKYYMKGYVTIFYKSIFFIILPSNDLAVEDIHSILLTKKN